MKNKFERLMYVFGWIRIEVIDALKKEISEKDVQINAIRQELNKLLAARQHSEPPQTPPSIVPRFMTMGEAKREGFGELFSSILNQLGQDQHDRKDVYKDDNMRITYCPQCDPLLLSVLLNFKVDASAKLILDTIAEVEEIDLGYSAQGKEWFDGVKPKEGEYNSIDVHFAKPEKEGLDITEMAAQIADKLKAYL